MTFEKKSELTPVGSHTFISSNRNNKIEFSNELNSIIFNNNTFIKMPSESILLEDFIEGNDIILVGQDYKLHVYGDSGIGIENPSAQVISILLVSKQRTIRCLDMI